MGPGGDTALTGLTAAEAARRLAARPPQRPPRTSRSYASIVVANVFTVFNLILLGFGALTLAFGHAEDALFLGILISNAGIGIVQEIRAKRALDRLAALVTPRAAVVRDAVAIPLTVSEMVEGDLVRVEAGDQLVADGRIESSDGLMLDESILTGESRPVPAEPGREVRSGSFAVEGAGHCVVTAVGAASYAERLDAEARAFQQRRSPLERALNRLLLVLVAVMLPLGTILGFALWERRSPLGDAVTIAAAAIVPLVPEGLILLTRLTYAVGVLRMAGLGVLAQQMNAIESLASTQVICLDKTGTLTEAGLRVVALVPAPGTEPAALEAALRRYAASSPSRNATLAAIAAHLPGRAEPVLEHVPFSSRRRWSGLRLGETSYVLGAPELFDLGPLADDARKAAREGGRVLALGRTRQRLDGTPLDAGTPGDLVALGLVVLAEQLRGQARETVAYLRSQGVVLKVISGDSPETVAAIAADAGIPCDGAPLDGRRLPEDPAELAEVVHTATVIGRVSPQGKRALVEALRAAGLRVAMVGDGVNDVPALKAAHLAIAQGTGSQMARSVADLVLVRGDFAAVPALLAEGRKILRNLQRVTKLFVTKSAFAAFVILTVGLMPESYPFLSRHLTLAGALTIGVPAFFLALAPSAGPWHDRGFLRDVARFAIPAGTAAGLAVVSSYLFARNVMDAPVTEARAVAVTALVLVGLYLVVVLEAARGVRAAAVLVLCLLLLGTYVAAIAVPFSRHFFDLVVPRPWSMVVALGAAGFAVAALALADDRFLPASPAS